MWMEMYVDGSGDSTKGNQMGTCSLVVVSEDKSSEQTVDLHHHHVILFFVIKKFYLRILSGTLYFNVKSTIPNNFLIMLS